ncbi:uncharacterized protein OCT59_026645 [Rhizophagus irregularis]|uniref:uncharacterized protein n=1 Tax=Rhizophagus irregularis TaxID=588596 RepID=UPI00333356EE|nr:hypothetical protein OCT59_026645 [Rhizophagus irregularis]
MEKPSFIRPFGWASEVWKNQVSFSRSGGLPCSEERENSKDSIGWASEEQKTKKPRFIRSVGFRRTKTQRFVSSGGLPKNENPKIKIRSGGLLCGKTKIRSGGVGFRPSGKEEPRFVRAGFCVEKPKPRFDRVEWASDLREKKNQDLFGRAFVWKNQDSIGWNGLSTFGKRRTKIRKSRVSRVSSEERKKPKIRKFG